MAANVRIWFSNSLLVVIMLSSLDTREISVNASLRFRNMHTLWEVNIRSGNGLIVASYLCCHLAALVHNELMSLLSHHCMFVFVVVHSHVLFKIGLAVYFLFWYFCAYLNINYSFLPCLTPTLVFTAENHLVFFFFQGFRCPDHRSDALHLGGHSLPALVHGECFPHGRVLGRAWPHVFISLEQIEERAELVRCVVCRTFLKIVRKIYTYS